MRILSLVLLCIFCSDLQARKRIEPGCFFGFVNDDDCAAKHFHFHRTSEACVVRPPGEAIHPCLIATSNECVESNFEIQYKADYGVCRVEAKREEVHFETLPSTQPPLLTHGYSPVPGDVQTVGPHHEMPQSDTHLPGFWTTTVAAVSPTESQSLPPPPPPPPGAGTSQPPLLTHGYSPVRGGVHEMTQSDTHLPGFWTTTFAAVSPTESQSLPPPPPPPPGAGTSQAPLLTTQFLTQPQTLSFSLQRTDPDPDPDPDAVRRRHRIGHTTTTKVTGSESVPPYPYHHYGTTLGTFDPARYDPIGILMEKQFDNHSNSSDGSTSGGGCMSCGKMEYTTRHITMIAFVVSSIFLVNVKL